MITKSQHLSIRLSSELVENLISLSHHEQIEIHAAFLAAWAGLWYRYTGLEQLVIGTEMEGSHGKVESAVHRFFRDEFF